MFKKILPLNSILFLRFLGLFLVLPLIALYAQSLEGSTPLLIGIVIGGYALTQALFQVPFGTLSDKFGRKWLIIFGLALFLVGSVISYIATDIYTLIFGRLLQGAGAVGSVISATITDLVEEERRAKAMAIVGGSIAMAFALAMVLGSTVGAYYGVDTLFLVTSILALLSILIAFKIPQSAKIEFIYQKGEESRSIFKDRTILYLLFSSLLQKGIMSIIFMLIPILLVSSGEWSREELWQLYTPAMVLGLLSMGPAVIFGEKRNDPKKIFMLSSTLFIVTSILISIGSLTAVTSALFIFFVAFNLIEPLIQSMVSKLVKVSEKGRALGYTNSFAYFGTFIGGTGAGLFLQVGEISTLGYILTALSIFWLVWTISIENPVKKDTLYMALSETLETQLRTEKYQFIDEWYINRTEKLIVVKFDSEEYLKEDIEEILKEWSSK